MTTCPRCGARLAPGQEYCLACGARVVAGRRPHSLRSSWALRSLVAGAAALVGAIAAIAATGSDGGGAAVVTATGGFASAPTTTEGEEAGSSAIAEWPPGEDGWTVALASLPQTGGRPAALAHVKAARAKGLTEVGILDSSRYASLHPGYWIVFSGIYASEAEATSALETARRSSRTASVRRIVP